MSLPGLRLGVRLRVRVCHSECVIGVDFRLKKKIPVDEIGVCCVRPPPTRSLKLAVMQKH